MKLGSINLHCLKEENQKEKSLRIAKLIKSLDLDVCFFQEVAQNKYSNYDFNNYKKGNNMAYIVSFLNMNEYFEHQKYGYDIFEEGLGIIAKKSFTEKDFFYISKNRSEHSWLTRITIHTKIDDLNFYTVHMGWTLEDEVYERQVDELVKNLKKDFILAGDFNCFHGSKEYNYLLSKGLISLSDSFGLDPLKNPTFHYELDSCKTSPNRMIDYFFTNQDLLVKDFKILLNNEDDLVSDHYFLYVDVIKRS